MAIKGTVVQWSNDEGWGILESAETPGGAWFNFAIVEQFHEFKIGEHVEFEFESADQDGYAFRATEVLLP